MPRFTGKVVIVTGSSFGIGRATALLFAKEGAKVTVTGRNEERLEESKNALLSAGIKEAKLNFVIADITTSSGQDELISSTIQKFKKIDILINNAGAAIPDAEGRRGLDQGIDTFKSMLDLNVQSVIEMTQKIRPYLAKSKGEIVNISSIAGCSFANGKNPYYATAKAALNQYTRSAAIELIAEGIRVNIVSPGIVTTGFASASGMDADKFYTETAKNPESIPCGFCGKPEHIAKVVAFLADRDSSEYIVGQNIIADGGTTLLTAFHGNMAASARAAAAAPSHAPTSRNGSRAVSASRNGSGSKKSH